MIYNPNSGHTMNEDNLKSAKKIFPEYGYNLKIVPTQYAGHAKEIVSHLEYVDLVVKKLNVLFIIDSALAQLPPNDPRTPVDKFFLGDTIIAV